MILRSTMRWLSSLALAISALAAQAATTIYYHNDLAGSPVVATDQAGNVVWRESYRPFGERLTNSAAAQGNAVWFTSRRQDAETGLVYMGARYYDPIIGRFYSIDPKGFDEGNVHSHNRYAYANNNPYRYVDRDGRMPAALYYAAALLAPEEVAAATTIVVGGLLGLYNIFSDKADATTAVTGAKDQPTPDKSPAADHSSGNSNPYKGPVDKPVVVVDPNGNAIPVDKGQRVNSSPNGDYQQVIGSDGKPTGDRMDRGGHRNHPDPTAQGPHGHRPGVTTPDGNPHLPIR